ncbi:MAG: DedA family protein [Candidatus Kapaibacterium sp.]
MIEQMVEYLSQVPWYWVLLFAMFITMLENIFPPSPSDSILVFCGALVSFGTVHWLPLLITSTIGSVLGFLIMFYLGELFGKRIVESDRFRFINSRTLRQPTAWFQKYGYWLIVANRFLSGTRAVISFFAGLSRLSRSKTLILSAISALLWNTILITAGILLGSQWEKAQYYMGLYGQIILPIAILILLYFAWRWDLDIKGNMEAPSEKDAPKKDSDE